MTVCMGGSSESSASLNGAHINGTLVAVEEPSTASGADAHLSTVGSSRLLVIVSQGNEAQSRRPRISDLFAVEQHHLADEVGQIAGLHPLHHPRAVGLDRAPTDLKTQGDLFIGQTSHRKLHNFPLPISQATR